MPIPDDSGFSLENLPLGIGAPSGAASRAVVAIGDHALDLAWLQRDGWLAALDLPPSCFETGRLNEFLGCGDGVWRALRHRISELLTDDTVADRLAPALHRRDALRMGLPVEVGDFVDFYSSIHHATNLGRILRPGTEPLLPNWRHLPVGYHGRSGTFVADGARIPRPSGLRLADGVPQFGPSLRLDVELEVGAVVGVPSERGRPIPIGDAGRHLAGLTIVNDWSARDIQAFEYQPLGPFLGKSFATSMSPWLVGFDALEPFRTTPPPQDPPVAEYLRTSEPWAFDIDLEVLLETAAMRAAGHPPHRISATSYRQLYWTPAQHLAHVTVNGANVRAGDVLASGTVSGPGAGEAGSLIELTENGAAPLPLPGGETRAFLEDGDRVIMRATAGGRDGWPRIGFGEVSGTVVPAGGR